jgi:hypothetical protein
MCLTKSAVRCCSGARSRRSSSEVVMGWPSLRGSSFLIALKGASRSEFRLPLSTSVVRHLIGSGRVGRCGVRLPSNHSSLPAGAGNPFSGRRFSSPESDDRPMPAMFFGSHRAYSAALAMLLFHAGRSFAPVCFGAKSGPAKGPTVITWMKGRTLWAGVSTLVSERLFQPRVESDDPNRPNIFFRKLRSPTIMDWMARVGRPYQEPRTLRL